MIKIWFFGTPLLAKEVLKDLHQSNKFDICFVVTWIDKPIWRKQIITSNSVKEFALKENIPIFQPEKLLNNQELFNKLKEYNVDYFIVVAYGKILPIEILEMPKKMCINVHGSILPKYRWASPIQSALINGDSKTGITIMKMSKEMDTWDIINILEIEIDKLDTQDSLFNKFAILSGKFLIDTLNKFDKWELKLSPQNNENASYCKKILKEDGVLDFKKDAETLFYLWKWLTSWPGIYTFFNWKKLIIEKCDYKRDENWSNKIWEVIKFNWDIWIKCTNWILILNQVKLEWSKSQNIKDFINGHIDFLGSIL